MKKFLTKFVIAFLSLAFFGLVFVKVAEAATLSLSPDSASVKSGESLKVEIQITTTGSEVVDGADAVLKFDSDKIKPAEVKAGSAFKNVVTKEGKGKITVTGLSSLAGSSSLKNSTIATVTFDVLESGDASVDFDFSSGLTTDSNVAQHASAKDILKSVSGGDYSLTATAQAQAFSLFRRAIPFVIFGIILILVGFGVYWFYRNRMLATDDVFVPHEIPLDRAPTEGETPAAKPKPETPLPDLGPPPRGGEGS